MSEPIARLIKPAEPSVVYHYTSLSAMMNILRTQTIWATDIGYLNDVSERNLLLNTVDEHLASFALKHNLDAEPFRQSDPYWPEGPFVASFSAERDSLNQWRSYCPIANGVSIGFKTECLKGAEMTWKPIYEGQEQSFWDFIPACDFKAVSYVEPNEDGLAIRTMNFAYAAALHSIEEMEAELAEGNVSVDGYFRHNVEAEASFYKHKGFLSESEYRLILPYVFQQFHQIQFRCTRSSMVPYVELRVPRSRNAEMIRPNVYRWDAVTEIVIGPTPNTALTQRAVLGFCRSIGLASANVTTSKLPYRDW